MKYKRNIPYIGDEEKKAVLEVLDSGELQRGKVVTDFENRFKKMSKKKYAIAISNCTVGLQLAIECIVTNELIASKCVGIPDFTFIATINAVSNLKLNYKVFDVDKSTYNMIIPEDDIDKCDIMIPVHSFGNPCIIPRGNYYIIEDAACAVGSDGIGYGDIQVYSLHGMKVITTGLGGMITTDNKKWADWMRKKTSHYKPDFSRTGYNYDISNINAAIGIEQLKKLKYIVKRRRELASRYNDKLKDYCYPQITNGSNYQSYVVRVPAKCRDKIIKHLRCNGIDAQLGTLSITSVRGLRTDCPNGIRLYNMQICLPLYTQMTQEEQDYIIFEFISAVEKYDV